MGSESIKDTEYIIKKMASNNESGYKGYPAAPSSNCNTVKALAANFNSLLSSKSFKPSKLPALKKSPDKSSGAVNEPLLMSEDCWDKEDMTADCVISEKKGLNSVD